MTITPALAERIREWRQMGTWQPATRRTAAMKKSPRKRPSLETRMRQWRTRGTWQTRYGAHTRRSQETSNS